MQINLAVVVVVVVAVVVVEYRNALHLANIFYVMDMFSCSIPPTVVIPS